MILRNLIFKLEVKKQRLPAGLVSHHEQASKANREQQHRVLWPAYNPDLAPRQASTEGLFQQTRLIAEIDFVQVKCGVLWVISEGAFCPRKKKQSRTEEQGRSAA